jgi:hypothetical protein
MPLSPVNRERRIRLLRKSASETATLFNAGIERQFGRTDAVAPSSSDAPFERIVDAYGLELDRFRRAHRFPHGRRIHNGKIVGLLTRILIRDGIEDVFVVGDSLLKHKGVNVAAGTFFVWHLACSIIAVDRERMPLFLRDDFMGAVSNCDDASPELLCLALTSLRVAFGDQGVGYAD